MSITRISDAAQHGAGGVQERETGKLVPTVLDKKALTNGHVSGTFPNAEIRTRPIFFKRLTPVKGEWEMVEASPERKREYIEKAADLIAPGGTLTITVDVELPRDANDGDLTLTRREFEAGLTDLFKEKGWSVVSQKVIKDGMVDKDTGAPKPHRDAWLHELTIPIQREPFVDLRPEVHVLVVRKPAEQDKAIKSAVRQ